MSIIGQFPGMGLPQLTNEATANEVINGKQVVNASGEVMTGNAFGCILGELITTYRYSGLFGSPGGIYVQKISFTFDEGKAQRNGYAPYAFLTDTQRRCVGFGNPANTTFGIVVKEQMSSPTFEIYYIKEFL